MFFYTLDHIGVRGGGTFQTRDALGVVTYPVYQLLFDPLHFESRDFLRIALQLSQQTASQVFFVLTTFNKTKVEDLHNFHHLFCFVFTVFWTLHEPFMVE